MKNLPLGAALVAGLSLAQPASGALLIVNNPSFESPAIAAGTFDTSAPPAGWSTYGFVAAFAGRDVGVLDPATTTLYADPVPDGDNVAVVFLLTGGPTETGLQQTLADTLQTGMTYTLNVHVGNISPANAPFNFSGFPGYRVDLLAGGQVVASDNNTLAPGEGRFLESTVAITIGAAHSLAGEPLGIRLVSLDGPNGIEVNFDHVRLDAVAVPEPANVGGAIGAGLAALALRRQLARKAAANRQA
jgi:hypothetical protein